jgi:methylamine dehydrogenase accessory protein MauD
VAETSHLLALSDAFVASYILLWAIVVVLALGVLALVRQVGLLTKRFPIQDPRNLPGPKIGETIPRIRAHALDAEPVVLGPKLPTRSLLVFTSDSCDTCERVLADIARIDSDTEELDTWLIFAREPRPDHAVRSLMAHNSIVSPEAFREWDIGSVPYGFIANEDGKIVAKGHLPHVEHLRSTLGLAPVNPSDADSYKEVWEHEPVGPAS